MTVDLGDAVPLGIEVRDAAGTLVDAQSVSLTVSRPDGSSETFVPDHAAVGRYTKDYLPALAGRYAVRWTTTGPATGYSDSFDVLAGDPGLLISLEQAKEALNIPPASTRDDEELRRMLATASGMVESITGPLRRQTFVETHQGGGSAISLRHPPVVSVDALTGPGFVPDAATLANTVLSPESGVLRIIGGSRFADPLTVSYTAGRGSVPPEVQTAVAIILEHLWATQRGWAARPTVRGEASGDAAPRPMGFALPSRAEQLLEPFRQYVVA